MSVERDENFVPRTRTDYALPSESSARFSDYHDIFEETPIYTLIRMIFMQLLGWQYYLLTNALGSPMYPSGTNVGSVNIWTNLLVLMQLQHFQPSSPLFKPHERNGIIASNIGLTVMSCILYLWKQQVGFEYFFKLYFVPYLVGHTGLPQNLCRCLTSVGDSCRTIGSWCWPTFITQIRQSFITVKSNGLSSAVLFLPLTGLSWDGQADSFSITSPMTMFVTTIFAPIGFISDDPVKFSLVLDCTPFVFFYPILWVGFSVLAFINLFFAPDNQPKVTEAIKTVLKDDYNYDSTVRICFITFWLRLAWPT